MESDEYKDAFAKRMSGKTEEEIRLFCEFPFNKWVDLDINLAKYTLSKKIYSPKILDDTPILTQDDNTNWYGNYKNKKEYVYCSQHKLRKLGFNKEYELIRNNSTQALFIKLGPKFIDDETVARMAKLLSEFCSSQDENAEIDYIISKDTKNGYYEILLPKFYFSNVEEKVKFLKRFKFYLSTQDEDLTYFLSQNNNLKIPEEGFARRTPVLHDDYEGDQKNKILNIEAYELVSEDIDIEELNNILGTAVNSKSSTIVIINNINNVKGDMVINNKCSIKNKINKTNKEFVKEFVKFIKKTPPVWYIPGTWIKFHLIHEAFTNFSGIKLRNSAFAQLISPYISDGKEKRKGKDGKTSTYYLLKKL